MGSDDGFRGHFRTSKLDAHYILRPFAPEVLLDPFPDGLHNAVGASSELQNRDSGVRHSAYQLESDFVIEDITRQVIAGRLNRFVQGNHGWAW